MAMGLVTPVLPSLIEDFAGSTASAGVWNGVLVALWGLMQFLCSPVIGSLSDRYGRRPVILISAAGLSIDWVLMALAPNLWWLAVGRLIGGATSASFTAIYAYMADITTPENRARAYGIVGAAFGAGFIAGPALGGMLGEWGPRVPFWVAAGLSALAFVYGWLVLPESLPAERRMAFAWSRANPLGALRLLRSHAELSGLAVVTLLFYFAHHVFSVVYVLYAEHRYGFGPFEVGVMLAFAGALDMAVQGWLTGQVTKRLGDLRTMVIGLGFGSVGLLAMGLAPTGGLFVAALLPNALWGLALPTLLSLMTQRVSEREQGQIQGASNSVASLAGVASPLFFGWVYSLSAAGSGLSFYIAAGILACAAAIGLATAGAGAPAKT
ncbi:TCR/Tet family MFS transporter [Novosphingobium sp. G106]|nr:TCR/Tet family MFS transporter [Novosphingobium sp. G106]